MKKIIVLLLCSFMLLSLFSCSIEQTDDNENKENNTSTTDTTDTDTAPTVKIQAEIVLGIYESVLKNEIKVYETDIQEYNYLRDCKTPYDRISLSDCEQLSYAYTDMDNDGINEIVIDCGDTLILRYYDGTVYLYPFTFRQLYDLKIDGTYAWNHTGQAFEYGENQIYFEGAELKTRELYRIVNDGEPNAEYYIGGKAGTKEEISKYTKENPKINIEFSPLEISSQNEITPEEALRIASEYWEIEDGFTDYGAGSVWVHRMIILDYPRPAFGYYHIGLQIDHYGRDGNDLRVLLGSRMKHLLVGAVTGECQEYVSAYGKG